MNKENQVPLWHNVEILVCSCGEEMSREHQELVHGVFPQLHNWALYYKLFVYDVFLETFKELANKTIVIFLQSNIDGKIAKNIELVKEKGGVAVVYEHRKSMKKFSLWMIEELKNAIASLWQDHLQTNWHYKTIEQKDNFQYGAIERYIREFIENKEVLENLKDYVEDESKELLPLVGKEGTGKSTLLAYFYQQLQKEQNEKIVIAYFIGSGPYSSSPFLMLTEICHTLKQHWNIPGEIPKDKKLLKPSNWTKFLKKAIIIIDAVDRLNDKKLSWLPKKLPEGVRLIASSTTAMVHLVNKTHLRPLRIANVATQNLSKIASRYYWKLPKKYETLDICNFRYAQLALKALQEFTFEDESFLLKENLPLLFENFVQKLEQHYGKDLVMTLLCVLQSTRYGMTEKELAEILFGVKGEENGLSVLYRLRDYLDWGTRGLRISSLALSKTVDSKFFSGEEEIFEWHGFIGSYLQQQFFLEKESDFEFCCELLWQMQQAELWLELVEVFVSEKFLQIILKKDLQFTEVYKATLKESSQEFRTAIIEALAYEEKYSRLTKDNRSIRDAIELLACELIAELIDALSHKEDRVRVYAMQILRKIAYKATPSLINALFYDDLDIKGQAAEILAGMREVRIEANLVALLMKALVDEDWIVRAYVAKALGNVRPVATQAIRALEKALFDQELEVKIYAIEALGNIGSHKAIIILKNALSNDHKEVKICVAKSLQTLGSKAHQAAPALIKELDGFDPEVKVALVDALATVADARAIPRLLYELGEEDIKVKKSVAKSLIELLSGYNPSFIVQNTVRDELEHALTFQRDVVDAVVYGIYDVSQLIPDEWIHSINHLRKIKKLRQIR